MRHYTSQTSVGGYVTRIKVVEQEQYDSGPFIFNGKLTAFKAMIDGILDAIPADYRDTASIEIEGVSSYGDSYYASVSIEYMRPATADEIAAHKDYQKARREVEMERELAQLNALKAKYGV